MHYLLNVLGHGYIASKWDWTEVKGFTDQSTYISSPYCQYFNLMFETDKNIRMLLLCDRKYCDIWGS